jgi:hypothetical protein
VFVHAVIQELDGMKKTDSGARTAIRWLEKQFHDGTAQASIFKDSNDLILILNIAGNRWLRSQKKNEARPLELIQYPKKKDREAWQYFKILECCNHLGSVRGVDSSAVKMRVTLLTCDNSSEEEKEEDAAALASAKKKTFSPKGLAAGLGWFFLRVDVLY